MPEGELPVADIFDPDKIGEIIHGAAGALATQMSLSTEWEQDKSASSRAVQFIEDVNPVSALYNGFANSDWSAFSWNNAKRAVSFGHWEDRDPARPSSISGATVVKVDAARRAALFKSNVKDFTAKFELLNKTKPGEARQYAKELVTRAVRATAATNEQFGLARSVNNEVNIKLNDALDRAYRISVGASVAFLVVGCLPIAVAAAGTTASTGVLMGSSGYVTLKVAGVGMVYGTLNSIAFDPETAKRAKVGGMALGPAGKAGLTNVASTFAQAGLDKAQTHQIRQQLQQATQAANRAAASNQIQQAMRAARAPAGAANTTAQRFLPGGVNEIQRQLLRSKQDKIAEEAAKKFKLASRVSSRVFVGIGLVMMRNEIKDAWSGLTAETDRTR